MQIQGRSPWYLAWLRLRRNRVALGSGCCSSLIVLFCLSAPLWAKHVAHTGPNDNHITDTVMIDGKETDVVSPTACRSARVCTAVSLGADLNGRDVMVRLIYGGRTRSTSASSRPLVTTVLAVFVGLLSGFYRGLDRRACSRGCMDVSGRFRCCCSVSRWARRWPWAVEVGPLRSRATPCGSRS